MKNIFFSPILIVVAFLLSFSLNSEAQVPQGINYQAVLRNASGQIMQNQNVIMKFTIHRATPNGTTVYEETQGPIQTNNFGLVNLQIGQGAPITGIFSSIQWGGSSFYLQVLADIGTGFINLGTTQFMTVPYSLVADTVLHGGGSGTVNLIETGTGLVGGPITTSGSISLANTGVTANEYGNSSHFPSFIVNAQGQLTSAENLPLPNSLPPIGPAGGDLSDTYPNPKVVKIQSVDVLNTMPTSGQVMTYNGTHWAPLSPSSGISWSLIGNAGINPSINFIGTIDMQPLDFRTNNILRTRITTKGQIETYNIGNSVFIGKAAGTADDLNDRRNVFIGDSAGFANTSGNNNVSIGYAALRNNTTLKYNIAIGSNALYKQSYAETNPTLSDQQNIAIGYNALYNNQPTSWSNGDNNIAIGRNALISNITGNGNVVVGNLAHQSNTHGTNNTILGFAALNSGTATASFITAVGSHSASTNYILGDFNTSIGYQTGVDADNRTNTIVLGSNGNLPLDGNNRVRIGNSSISSIGGQVGWTTISDDRIKENIKNDVKGLSFIMNLKPITYNYSIEKSNIIQERVDTLSWTGKHDIEKMRISGFRAQEVEAAAIEAGYIFSGVDKPQDTDGLWGLRYSEFTVPLVKAVQEQQIMIEELKQQIEILKNQISDLSNEKNNVPK